MASFRTGPESRAKNDGSFVTEADLEIERRVRQQLGEAFPDHGILGEEYGTTVPGTIGPRSLVQAGYSSASRPQPSVSIRQLRAVS